MSDSNTPTQKLRKICDLLGDGYKIKVIDLEQVIHKRLCDGYDFEISGLNNRKQSFNATLYIWETSPNLRTVETISDIESLESLQSVLDTSTKKYLKIQD